MRSISNVTIVIPSLNPDEKLRKTVLSLTDIGFTDIVLVNDGSAPDFDDYFPAELPQCTLLRHPVNRGKGAAMKTAFRYILQRGDTRDGVVTVDGDGQHKASDVLLCAQAMQDTGSVILGTRNFDQKDVPPRSRIGNKITSLVFRLFCGLKISDTQTGLRAIPWKYLPQMPEIDGDRYEYETNMLLRLQSCHIPYAEQQIETVYIEENKTSHFRPFRDSVRIYSLILKFISSSLISSVIDLFLFFILSLFMPTLAGAAADGISTFIARAVSSAANYAINKKSVFRSASHTKGTLVRYYILAVGILLCSGAAISGLSYVFGLNSADYAFIKTLLKFIIDSVLFFASFRIQREWVFTESDESNTQKQGD